MQFGQETKKIKNDNEVYFVLKTDKNIRHGNYQKKYNDASTMINGYYKNGSKDSIWDFYNSDGKILQKFDYSKNEIVFYIPDAKDKQIKRKLSGADTMQVTLERFPLYLGGDALMLQPLHNVKYPTDALKNNIKRRVYISFTIDKTGTATNHKVLKGIGGGCDEEALRVVKSIPDYWLPGIYNGHAVDVDYVIPVGFNIK